MLQWKEPCSFSQMTESLLNHLLALLAIRFWPNYFISVASVSFQKMEVEISIQLTHKDEMRLFI